MSIKYNSTISSKEYHDHIGIIYSELKNKLLKKVNNLSVKIDRYSAQDIMHDAYVDLLKRNSLNIETSIDDAIKKYLNFKTKLNAKSFLKPRYQKEFSKSTTHLDFLGLDYENLNNENVGDKIISDERLEVQKIKKILGHSEWKIIELYFYQNLSSREIGKKMGCSHRKVQLKLKDIISKIKQFISTDGEISPSVPKINYQSISGSAADRSFNLQYAV